MILTVTYLLTTVSNKLPLNYLPRDDNQINRIKELGKLPSCNTVSQPFRLAQRLRKSEIEEAGQ